MIHEFCSNCMEEIITEPIMDEVEINILGDEGVSERDVPVIRFFCSEICRKEFFVKPEIKL